MTAEDVVAVPPVAIVVGGDRDHGVGLTRALVAAGHRVVVTPPPGAALASSTSASAEVVPFDGNIETVEAAYGAVQTALDRFGQLDAVVVDTSLRTSVGDAVERAVDLELRAAYTMLRHATIVFRQQRSGRAVLLCSRDGLTGSATEPMQAAVGGGLIGLTKAVSLGMARYGVPCNAVALDDLDNRDENSTGTLEALVTYLASGATPATTGHVFGVRGRLVSLWAHERPVVSIFDADGLWEVDDLKEIAPTALSVDPLLLADGLMPVLAGGSA